MLCEVLLVPVLNVFNKSFFFLDKKKINYKNLFGDFLLKLQNLIIWTSEKERSTLADLLVSGP